MPAWISRPLHRGDCAHPRGEPRLALVATMHSFPLINFAADRRLTMTSRRLSPALLAAGLFAFSALTSATLHAQRMELSDPSASAVVVESAAIKSEVTGRIAVTTF